MSKNKLNISKHTNAILDELGLLPPDVASLFIQPTKVTATIYKRDANNQKYIEDDQAVTDTLEFEVRT